MFKPRKDALDNLFGIQSFDPATNTFGGMWPGDDRVYLGAMWVGEPINGLDEGLLLSLQSVLAGSMPTGSVVQFAMLATPDIDDTVKLYRTRKFTERGTILDELINRHAGLIKAGKNTPVVKATEVLLRRKRLIVTLKCSYEKPSATNIHDFAEQATKMESSLKANGFFINRANKTDYLQICRLITHINDAPDARYDDTKPLNEQIFYAGDEVIVRKDHIEFNTGSTPDKNFVMGAMSPKFFPKEFSLGMMNFTIGCPKGMSNQIKGPHMMVMTLYFPDQTAKKADITKKAAWINHQLFGGSAAKFMPTLAIKKEGFDTLLHEIEHNSAILVEATFALWLFSPNHKALRGASEEIRTYWASLGFDMREDKIILDTLLNESLPLGASDFSSESLNRRHTMTSSQAAQFLPIIGEFRGSVAPTVLLTTRRGEVGGFDLYASSSNYNAVLVAEAGAGKSFVTQRIIADYLAEGAKVWVIDQGRSYQKLAAAVGGTFIEFSPESDVCLNPFTSFLKERNGDHKKIEDEMDMISSLIERMCAQRDPLGDLEMEVIRKAVRQSFIENHGHTTIRDVADWLSAQNDDARAQDLALRLDSFAYGQYSRYFNDHANVDMGADLVVMELDDLKTQKQLQQVVLLQLISQISSEMYLTRGRKKVLIIDEAWSLMDDEVMARAMETAYRTVRKHDGAVLTVTQGISDLYASPAGRAMVHNAAWRIILQQKSEAIDQVYNDRQLNLDAYYYQMLKTVRTVPGSHSEMMIVGGNSCGIYRLTVDKFTQAMFSTTGAARNQVLNDISSGMPVVESIQRLMMGDQSYGRVKSLEDDICNLLYSEATNRFEVEMMLKKALARVGEELAQEE